MAAQHLGVSAATLSVSDGMVTAAGDPAKHVSYGELIGGRYFHAHLNWNGQIGNALVSKGEAKPKSPDAYKVVGKSFPRRDIAAKVFARATYVVDVKVPGMLHARMVRPPVAGAMPVAVDEASVGTFPASGWCGKKGCSPSSRKRNGTPSARRRRSR